VSFSHTVFIHMIYVNVSYIGKNKFLKMFGKANLHLRMEKIQIGYWDMDIQALVHVHGDGIVIMANSNGE